MRILVEIETAKFVIDGQLGWMVRGSLKGMGMLMGGATCVRDIRGKGDVAQEGVGGVAAP